MPKTLYLIDGHALAYRSYFAIAATGSRFVSRSGEPTAATFGFVNVLMSLLEKEKPDYLAVAFDTGRTFRSDEYPDYKATREKMPEDLVPQIERLRGLMDAFHFPRLEMEGFEADDVIGSIAKQMAEKGLNVKIITGDKDLLQLVTDRIVVNLAGGKLSEAEDYFPDGVVKKMGVRPDQVVDLKALIGDPSDNIPGVKGIGQKTAEKLLSQYGTLNGVYQHIEDLKGKVQEMLYLNKDTAYLSYFLAQIRTDLSIPFDLEQARTDNIDIEKVMEIFNELQFRTLTSRFQKLLGQGTISAESGQMTLFEEEPVKLGLPAQYVVNVTVVDTDEKLTEMARRICQSEMISFDTETTSTDPMQAEMVGISLAIEEGSAYYIPVGHKGSSRQLEISKVIEAITPAFTDQKIQKIGHNMKYDALMLLNYGLRIHPFSFDTMIAGWLLEPESHRLGLKRMAESELNIVMTEISELIGTGKKQLTMDRVAIEDVAPYASADAEVPLRLEKILRERLEKNGLMKVFEEIEMPLIPVLMEMEHTGIKVDGAFLKDFANELNQRLLQIQKEVYKLVGYDFNLNSTQQLSKALFETLHLTAPDSSNKTKAGGFSTSADVLENMKDQHEVVALILEQRELSKLVSTYLEALPRQINPKTGRVHTSFNQTGSVTGRLASSDPNLQNIPTRTELGHRVREGFVADKGQLLVSVDYSQIELRVAAHMSGDKAMINAFLADQDIHAATAAAIHDVPIGQVTKEQRSHAKAINFGLLYGMNEFGLMRATELTLAEATKFRDEYFAEFPGIRQYIETTRAKAEKQGFVETLLGRKRYFPQLKGAATPQVRSRALREAINSPVQGTAADIMKIAMIHLPAELKKAGLKAKMLLQVHDELLLECPETELDQAIEVTSRVMANAYKINVPLKTDAAFGKNWGDLKDYEN